MNVLHTSKFDSYRLDAVAKNLFCARWLASRPSTGRLGVLPRRKHCPDQTVSSPLSTVPHYCHRQKESVPSRQDPTYSDSRRATPSTPKPSIDSLPTDDQDPFFSRRWTPSSRSLPP